MTNPKTKSSTFTFNSLNGNHPCQSSQEVINQLEELILRWIGFTSRLRKGAK
jgi:hypothetical protein